MTINHPPPPSRVKWSAPKVKTFLPCKNYLCLTQIKMRGLEDTVYTKRAIDCLYKSSSVQNFVLTRVNMVSKRKIKNKQIV